MTLQEGEAQHASLLPLLERLRALWDDRSRLCDWGAYERLVVDVLRSDLTPATQLALCREALDAVTKRGYFVDRPYATDGPDDRLT